MTETPTGNRLGQATSPYLLQHADNPVHWREWGPEIFDEAQASNRPILLSVGYAACHWCHVMAHESFENAEIAAVMNELYIPVKVDREERPDVDTIYQHALAMLGQQGGWPLTMFLTPSGEPFWGGTYFPPESRYGRPGFVEVLRGVAQTWGTERDKVQSNVGALREGLAKLGAGDSGPASVPLDAVTRIAARLVREVDPFFGGVGDAPKFPQVPTFILLWRAWTRTRLEPFERAVLHTLTAMSQGGIYDHLGGGFARYSVDERWLVPHFEKMLYDNAQMIDLLTLVWRETRSPLFATRVAETADWVLREMIADGGGFASTLDADSEGEEGKFYVWSSSEVIDVLGSARAALFAPVYDVTSEGNWEGKTILNRSAHPGLGDAETEAALAACRAELLAVRDQRIRPGWDDKVLADWNGLMIAALCEAATAFDRPDWLAAARTAFAFVCREMQVDGRLRHAWRGGVANHPATLDDYAAMCRAGLALIEATGDEAPLARIRDWIAVLDRHYWDDAGGGYFLTADDTGGLIVRTKLAHDNATPAGNGIMVDVLARLWLMTGDAAYRDRADAVVAAFSGALGRQALPLATLLNGIEMLQNPTQIVLVGQSGDADFEALDAIVRADPTPARLVQRIAPGADLPPGHPAAGKGQVQGRATAYVCHGMSCSLPATKPEELRERLAA